MLQSMGVGLGRHCKELDAGTEERSRIASHLECSAAAMDLYSSAVGDGIRRPTDSLNLRWCLVHLVVPIVGWNSMDI